jgi:hypothetical protein
MLSGKYPSKTKISFVQQEEKALFGGHGYVVVQPLQFVCKEGVEFNSAIKVVGS